MGLFRFFVFEIVGKVFPPAFTPVKSGSYSKTSDYHTPTPLKTHRHIYQLANFLNE